MPDTVLGLRGAAKSKGSSGVYNLAGDTDINLIMAHVPLKFCTVVEVGVQGAVCSRECRPCRGCLRRDISPRR